MRLQRSDVVLVQFPFSSGVGAKLRPALVVQSDRNNVRLANVILAAITSTTHRVHEVTQVFLDLNTPDAKHSGLLFSSAVTCENLATVELRLVTRVIGKLPPQIMQQVDDCLRASLQL